MRWLSGTKTVRASSLKLPLGYDLVNRVNQPHVIELAKSIRENGGKPAHLPVVHVPTWELVAGGDRFAALCLNGLRLRTPSPDTDGLIEVRAFEGTAEDVERLRRHENIHRRQDRDKWLREQVEAEAAALAGARVKDSVAAVLPEGTRLESGEVTGEGPPAAATGATDGGAGEPGQPADAGNPGEEPAPPEAPHAVWCTLDKAHGGPCLAAAVTKADKTAARKKVAEREGTTPAAVKQAEQRDRKKRGETRQQSARQKHDDSAGHALTKEQLQVQHALIDVAAAVSAAVVRLRNFIPKRPDAEKQFALEVRLEKLKDWLKSLEVARKGAGL